MFIRPLSQSPSAYKAPVLAFSGAARDRAEMAAKEKLIRSGAVQQVRDRFGLIIWKVEQHPHWLQVYVDKAVSAIDLNKLAPHEFSARTKEIEAWLKGQEQEIYGILKRLFSGEQKEFYLAAMPREKKAPDYLGCCGAGCTGCFRKGPKIPSLKPDGTD